MLRAASWHTAFCFTMLFTGCDSTKNSHRTATDAIASNSGLKLTHSTCAADTFSSSLAAIAQKPYLNVAYNCQDYTMDALEACKTYGLTCQQVIIAGMCTAHSIIRVYLEGPPAGWQYLDPQTPDDLNDKTLFLADPGTDTTALDKALLTKYCGGTDANGALGGAIIGALVESTEIADYSDPFYDINKTADGCRLSSGSDILACNTCCSDTVDSYRKGGLPPTPEIEAAEQKWMQSCQQSCDKLKPVSCNVTSISGTLMETVSCPVGQICGTMQNFPLSRYCCNPVNNITPGACIQAK